MNELVLFQESSKDISESLHSIFDEYSNKRKQIEHFYEIAKEGTGVLEYFLKGSEMRSYVGSKLFELEPAIKVLDAEYWSKVLKMTNVLECMTAQKRNEWQEQIHKYETIEFNESNVVGTVNYLLSERGNFIGEKVLGIYNNLSRSHKTNEGMSFKQRFIIEGLLSGYGHLYTERISFIHDLRQMISMFKGEDAPSHYSTDQIFYSLYDDGRFGKWFEIDGGNFKVKAFKKGTAHFEINENLADFLNKILSSCGQNIIGDASINNKQSSKNKDRAYAYSHIANEVSSELMEIARRKLKKKDDHYEVFIYSEETLSAVAPILKYIGGKQIKKSWFQFETDPSDILVEIAISRKIPDTKSHQFYPTPKNIANYVQHVADISPEHKILEPSAGHGGLIDGLEDKNRIETIELSDLGNVILKSKGYNTTKGDFLKISINKYESKFDRILINPPYSDRQFADHVKKSLQFLKDDGIVVAVLPVNYSKYLELDGYNMEEMKTFVNEFSETSIPVAVVRIYKK